MDFLNVKLVYVENLWENHNSIYLMNWNCMEGIIKIDLEGNIEILGERV